MAAAVDAMPGQTIRTEVVTFRGVVQGVGFRPTVYRIAQRLGMKGRVRNTGGVVQIVCTGTPEEIDAFVREINLHKPPMAQITGVRREVIGTTVFHEFSIGQSSKEEDEIAIIPADIAVCDDCLREFYEAGNPRYLHPFISCTNCGPRFSIMEQLPYDRGTTTMVDFPMCGLCEGEYTDPANRRYHAQTVSCHDCGPQPAIMGEAERVDPGDGAVETAVLILKEGGVLALKGVGGYYLSCSPFSETAVQNLRVIKRREQKPFAVMFRDVRQIREYCIVSPPEEAALLSPQRPIVLLEQRTKGDGSRVLAPGVCNTSRFVGAFLPSFGLQYLLLDAAGPLIMTSANVSELPLITDDSEMKKMAAGEPLIAGVLFNERRIAAGLDDSVVRVVGGDVQLIRRSKGYVPTPVFVQAADGLTKDEMIFAAGGHLKSAFAISRGAFSCLSRHIGDLDSIESEAVYKDTYDRMKAFFKINPGLAVCDLHPRYFPTRFAESLGLPIIHAQHHHAHIASVMAEHGLSGPVTGVSFDGTGYGTDGAIWGGEILVCEGASFERFSHLKYIDIIGGDASMKDAWKSAVSHIHAFKTGGRGPSYSAGTKPPGVFEIDLAAIVAYSEAHDTLKAARPGSAAKDYLIHSDDMANSEGLPVHRDDIQDVEAALRAGVNTVKTSSMGRLFDAVCAMLGIHFENRYEGECAIMLENAAQRALDKQRGGDVPTEQERLALSFHSDIASAILTQCQRARNERGINRICLSGGVFQNRILMEEALLRLRGDGFTVYYNIHVPPNDGGLALGQNYIGMTSV